MSGIYIHIPFCKSRCIYCAFYSTTASEIKDKYVDALCKEMLLRRDYLGGDTIETIYLGGGTPSQLTTDEIEKILNHIYKYNKVADDAEITLECNPDDVTEDFARYISTSCINRISMGTQTFSDSLLRLIHRRHSADQVETAVNRLRSAGIKNISIDLMFGFPEEDTKLWHSDITKAIELGVEHISAYSLMYEEGTQLYKMKQNGTVTEIDEDTSLAMYNNLIDTLHLAGYEHYEISNFAKPGFRSRHNSSYWHGVPYLGLGAAAHSFNIKARQWNIDDIKEYINAIESGRVPAEVEKQTKDNAFDDTVMTGLRTCEGIDLKRIMERFGNEYAGFLMKEAAPHIKEGRLKLSADGNHLSLTRKGLFVSDSVMSDLMHV